MKIAWLLSTLAVLMGCGKFMDSSPPIAPQAQADDFPPGDGAVGNSTLSLRHRSGSGSEGIGVLAFVSAPPGGDGELTATAPAEPDAAALERARAEYQRKRTKPRSATGRRPNKDRHRSPNFDREGFSLGVGAGLMNCPQDVCAGIKVAGNGHLETGYRFGFVAAHVLLDGGGAKLDETILDTTGSLTFLSVGPQVLFYPVREGRFDPYLGGLIGYQRTKLSETADEGFGDVTTSLVLKRPVASVAMGLNIYVTKGLAIGPRLDLWFPFAGTICDDSFGEDCASVADTAREIDDATGPLDRKLFLRGLPKPRTVSVHLSATF